MPKPPFLVCAVAHTNSGKTTLLINLLLNEAAWNKVFHQVIVISPTVDRDSKWDLIRNKRRFAHWDRTVQEELEQLIDSNAARDAPGRILILFDDFLGENLDLKTGFLADLATSFRHKHVSLIFSGQKMTALSTVIRANASHFFIWPATSGREVDTIVHELRGTLRDDEFRRLVTHVWSTPRTPLVVDMWAPQRTRYRRGFEEIVYPVE